MPKPSTAPKGRTTPAAGVSATPDEELTPLELDRRRIIADMTRRLTGEKESKTSTLPYADPIWADRIDAANAMRGEISKLEKELKQAKDEFIAEVVGLDVPGLRTPSVGIIVNVKSRNSLSVEKLLEKLPADQLAECYVEGAQYYEVRFQEIKEGQ